MSQNQINNINKSNTLTKFKYRITLSIRKYRIKLQKYIFRVSFLDELTVDTTEHVHLENHIFNKIHFLTNNNFIAEV